MALKIYRSKCILGTHITVGNLVKHIHFTGHSNGGGYYISTDKLEQDAIEKDAWFKDGTIRIHEVVDDVPSVTEVPAEEDKPAKKIVEGITKCSQARDWIEQNLGIDCGPVISRAKIFEIAEQNNVEFPDLPKENKK